MPAMRRPTIPITMLFFALVLQSCDPSIADVPFVDEATLEVYEPPPEPCPNLTDDSLAVLFMSSNPIVETYLPGEAFGVSELAIDYTLLPRPRVMRVDVQFDFDAASPVLPVAMTDECASTLPTDAWTDHPYTDTVVGARVVNHYADGEQQEAWVFVPRGTRSVTLDTSSIEDDATVDDPWLFVFEPASGAARIMLRLLRQSPLGTTLEVDGVPALSGSVGLIRSDFIEYDEAHDVVYAPFGFGASWRAGATHWYGAVVGSEENGPVPLLTHQLPPSALDLASEEEVALQTGRPSALIPFSSENETSPVTTDCDATVTISAPGYLDLGVSNGERDTTMGPGEATVWTAECNAGQTKARFDITGRSWAARGAFALVTVELDEGGSQ